VQGRRRAQDEDRGEQTAAETVHAKNPSTLRAVGNKQRNHRGGLPRIGVASGSVNKPCGQVPTNPALWKFVRCEKLAFPREKHRTFQVPRAAAGSIRKGTGSRTVYLQGKSRASVEVTSHCAPQRLHSGEMCDA